MKNFIIATVLCLSGLTSFSQYFEGSIANAGNFLIFSVRPKPGGGNIVISEGKQLINIEFFVRYSNASAPFTWGTPITGSSFAGAVFAFKGTDEYGSYPGKKLDRFQWLTSGASFVPSTVMADPLTNVTYLEGTTYEVFRVPLLGAPATVDFELVHNDDYVPAYIAITDRTNSALDVSSVGTGDAFYGTGFNIVGRDQILPINNVPVPVKFKDFSVVKISDKALLTWLVENEASTTAKYEVLRSTNGIDFETVTTITPLNNGRSSNNYTFTQVALSEIIKSGVIYFRIKQTDKDGKFAITEIKNVRLNFKGLLAGVYPNPIKQNANVNFDLEKDAIVILSVTDALGKQLLVKQVQGFKGANIKPIDMSKMAGGNYLLKLQAGDETKILPIVKATN